MGALELRAACLVPTYTYQVHFYTQYRFETATGGKPWSLGSNDTLPVGSCRRKFCSHFRLRNTSARPVNRPVPTGRGVPPAPPERICRASRALPALIRN